MSGPARPDPRGRPRSAVVAGQVDLGEDLIALLERRFEGGIVEIDGAERAVALKRRQVGEIRVGQVIAVLPHACREIDERVLQRCQVELLESEGDVVEQVRACLDRHLGILRIDLAGHLQEALDVDVAVLIHARVADFEPVLAKAGREVKNGLFVVRDPVGACGRRGRDLVERRHSVGVV